jgi:hypothetical protein
MHAIGKPFLCHLACCYVIVYLAYLHFLPLGQELLFTARCSFIDGTQNALQLGLQVCVQMWGGIWISGHWWVCRFVFIYVHAQRSTHTNILLLTFLACKRRISTYIAWIVC